MRKILQNFTLPFDLYRGKSANFCRKSARTNLLLISFCFVIGAFFRFVSFFVFSGLLFRFSVSLRYCQKYSFNVIITLRSVTLAYANPVFGTPIFNFCWYFWLPTGNQGVRCSHPADKIQFFFCGLFAAETNGRMGLKLMQHTETLSMYAAEASNQRQNWNHDSATVCCRANNQRQD